MPTTVQRIFNFSAGPAVLPPPVLEEAQRDLVSLPGVGMSILEISHRSKAFESILAHGRGRHPRARRHPRRLRRAVPAGRRQPAVLDGADEPAARGRQRRLRRDRRVVAEGGQGSQAPRQGDTSPRPPRPATSSRVPDAGEINWDANAAYAHVTSNNTIFGTQFQTMPESGRRRATSPLVCDASSDIFSRPIDVAEVRPDLRRRAEEPRARPA